MKKRETLFHARVLKYLNSIPYSTTMNNIEGSNGEEDIRFLYKGKFYAIELKKEDKKGVMGILQMKRKKLIEASGGIYLIVDNMQEIKEKFNET